MILIQTSISLRDLNGRQCLRLYDESGKIEVYRTRFTDDITINKVDMILVDYTKPQIGEFYLYEDRVYKAISMMDNCSPYDKFVILENVYDSSILVKVYASSQKILTHIVASTIIVYDDTFLESRAITIGKPIGLEIAALMIKQNKNGEFIYQYVEGSYPINVPEIYFTKSFKMVEGVDFVPIQACEIDNKFECDQDTLWKELDSNSKQAIDYLRQQTDMNNTKKLITL